MGGDTNGSNSAEDPRSHRKSFSYVSLGIAVVWGIVLMFFLALNRTPMKKIAKPEDVANQILVLSSPVLRVLLFMGNKDEALTRPNAADPAT